MRKLLILDPRDNIAVCLVDLNQGDVVEQDDFTITVLSRIPRGHKIASSDIAKNDGIIKYGERMGHAVAPIARGEHVHTHNILGDRLSSEQV
jgi:hypothetical protein